MNSMIDDVPDSYFPFYSAIGVMFCIAIIILIWTSLRDRNESINSRAGKFLIYSLSILLVPSIILLAVQSFIVNPFMESTLEQKEKFAAQNRYLGSITLEWDGKIINEHDKLKNIEQTISHRLHNNKQVSAITSDANSSKDLFSTKIIFSPHTIPADDPSSNLQVRNIIKTIQSPPVDNTGEDILSIRTVLTDPMEEPPAGFRRLPWKNGFVYVAETSHITAKDVLTAKPHGKNSLVATLTEAGQLRMNAMARYADASKSQVALIHHGKVVGIYEPEPAITDQFIINPIPKEIAMERAADELSMPHLGTPSSNIKFDYVTPSPEGFRYSLADKIASIPLVVSVYAWLGLMFLMLIVTSVGMLVIHARTKTSNDHEF